MASRNRTFKRPSSPLADERLARTPATRVENACATGSAALYAALGFVEAGRGRVALVVGAAKMTGHGDRSEELARIAAKNHRNGVANPFAHMRKDFGFELCNASAIR